MYMFSCVGGLKVMHQTAVSAVPGSISGSGKDIYVCFFVLLLLCFVQNPLIVGQFCNYLCNVIVYSTYYTSKYVFN